MPSDSSSDNSLRTFVPLCFVTFFLFASYDNGIHATSGYVFEIFWGQRFPNRSDSNSTDKLHCTTNKSSEAYRDGQIVQKQVTRWSVYISLAHGVPLILSSVLFSFLSDTFGRKPFLFIGAFGICIKQFLITLAMFSRLSVFLFPPFTLIEGFCGSWVTQIAISMCVISDLTSAGKSRSFYIAIFTFVYGFGSSAGTFVSGYVVTLLGHEYSMAVSFGVAFLAFVCTCFIPESIANSQKQQKKFSCCGNCREILQFYTEDDPDHPGSFRWKFIIAVMAFIFIKLAKLGASSMEAYYLEGSPYCFTPEKIGVFETVKSGFSEIFILVGIKAMHQCFVDESIALLSNLSSIAQFLLFGIGSTELYLEVGTLHMSIIINNTVNSQKFNHSCISFEVRIVTHLSYVYRLTAVIVGSLGMASVPMIQGFMSRMCPPQKQGLFSLDK